MDPATSAAPCYKSAPVILSHRNCNRDEGKEEAMQRSSTTYINAVVSLVYWNILVYWCTPIHTGSFLIGFQFLLPVAHSTSVEIVTNNRTINKNENRDLYHLMISSDKGLLLTTLALPCTQSTVEISSGFCCYYQRYNILQSPSVQARLGETAVVYLKHKK